MYQLKILRFDDCDVKLVWMLSDSIGGIYTHWIGSRRDGRSKYCRGDGECPSNWHKEIQIWKGYTSVLVYDQAKVLWFPYVLEVTENLELDLRDRYARGQIWQISKKPDGKKRVSSLSGTLTEEVDEARTPPALDYIPVLKWVFQTTNINLGAVNRMPPKTMVRPEAGYVPKAAAHTVEESIRRQAEAELEEERKRALQERQAKIDAAKAKQKPATDEEMAKELKRRAGYTHVPNGQTSK